MKKLHAFGIVTLCVLLFVRCNSGLVTTSNSCYNLITSSNAKQKTGILPVRWPISMKSLKNVIHTMPRRPPMPARPKP